MKKLNKNIILIVGFIILLLLYSINFNNLSDETNFPSFIGIIGLLAFVFLKSKN